ncbi:NADPH:quinone oxidoreductase family protein [Pseudohoeflea coraliihabitans]|uniref:NADPH:quinone oxidoreductase family protein n=1 Tax=Pseudohoeflea coraliihabitans TaxID=2860393 RepID=A0ABS6WR52_9HYPH|nr:NADPH:quinone oxidoreductase family protein [Pseudohoeflea sp. DP4N28-3]MBW3098255.1 NADPH:quinone oxidoreductase family protein [Pseudohoeflea sp. DP4N28-3]
MKAIICNQYGSVDDLVYGERPDPQPAADEVVIATQAAGVNFPDGLLVKGLYQARPETPFVPGMEAAGTICAVGDKVTGLKVGDRCVATVALGGYAEKLAAAQDSVFKMPDSMQYGEACALMCAWGTSHYALKQRGALKAGETLVVLGAAGATGIGAIQCGKAMGARVIAVASSQAKRDTCLKEGADAALPYDDLKTALKEATGGKGADVVFDPVGGAAFDAASRAMARHGRYLVIGFASGEIPKLPVNIALLKEFSLVGVFWGAFTRHQPRAFADNMRELFAWHQEGKVRPHVEGEWPLAEAPAVLNRILERGAIGKSILVP